MLTVVTSGKAAPGTTTSTWALALSWPQPVLVADCDAAGGDMSAGFLAGCVPGDRNLLSWSMAARRDVSVDRATRLLADHAFRVLEPSDVWLIPGLASVTQGSSFTPDTWSRFAAALERCSAVLERDVLVDAGRLLGDSCCWPVIRGADRVLVTVQRSVRSVHAARVAVQRLREQLGDLTTVGALVVGDGPYSAREVATALELPLAGSLPDDRPTAAALSDGAPMRWRTLQRSPLLRSASAVTQGLRTGLDPWRLPEVVQR